MAGPRRPRTRWEDRLLLLALAGGVPAVALAALALARWPAGAFDRAVVAALVLAAWIGFGLAVRGRVVRMLQTLSNMVAAMRERDYSMRARGADTTSAFGLALWELNALSDALRRRRLEAREATGLLRQVMDSIDVALFGFDESGALRLVNREGEALVGLSAERAIGRRAADLGLGPALEGETPRLVELRLPGRAGRWEARRGAFRQEGRPHELLALSDLSRALREEEREAWVRLVRVLSHEINNSLAPIQSLAGSLRAGLARGPGGEAAADLAQGLGVIEGRARSLGRFMNAYAALARLPKPAPAPLDLGALLRHVAAIETRLPVAVREGPVAILRADAAQLEQMFINLVRNAADAALETRGGVWIAWDVAVGWAEVRIEDEGPGLGDTSNLFVPFFTTKPEGSGIGLALARQIAEVHGGSVTLEHRAGAPGCVALVRLPLPAGPPAPGGLGRLAVTSAPE